MAGYAKVADLMSKHAEVAAFQRFDFLHNLDIMFLQAELVHLEDELRDSMKDDAECENIVASSQIDVSRRGSRGLRGTLGESENLDGVGKSQGGDGTTHNADIPLRSLHSQSDLRSISDAGSENNDRVRSGRDWYVLANMRNTSTWDLVLQTRDKLKEYDKAVMQYTQLKSQPSPNTCDVKFLRRWFKEEKMGDFPLIGLDSNLWETSPPSSLVAIQARKGEDPLGSLFLNKVFLWWHKTIGHRVKKSVDEEQLYFEYSDKAVLRVANILGSVISSALLVCSVIALAIVKNVFVRLGIVAAFTQMFSLALVLVTNARKVEIFAATAAFVAVQVVFVGSTYKQQDN